MLIPSRIVEIENPPRSTASPLPVIHPSGPSFFGSLYAKPAVGFHAPFGVYSPCPGVAAVYTGACPGMLPGWN